MVKIVNILLSYLTVASQIFLLACFAFYPIDSKKFLTGLRASLYKHSLALAWIVAIVATLGSLFYSDIAGYEPCKLCWLQRIFMYPLAVILGIATFKKDRGIISYALPVLTIGLLISIYHNYIYYGGSTPWPCEAFGLGVSCTKRYVFELGYITIPMMSLTAYLLTITFLLFGIKKR
jgi:disulfide bond formation protein DsbB